MTLDTISKAIFQAGEASRLRRNEHNKLLEESEALVMFLPDPDTDSFSHGLGWFRADEGFVAYRRYSNGYDLNRAASITNEEVKVLYEALQGAKK